MHHRLPFSRRHHALLTLLALLVLVVPGVSGSQAADSLCTANYGGFAPRPAKTLRLGIDPGLAGSVGGSQLPTVPDNPTKDMAALRRLRPAHRVLVLRLNRLFFSDGQAGISRFVRRARQYTRAGFDVEVQVRYHPSSAQAGNIRAWTAYVRRVVDAFGPNRHVVAMTITNEVNITFSPNTSDGSYPRAQDALIQGIEAAHSEALRRHFRQLRFGFTYAYRLSPSSDAAFFAYLKSHGGSSFQRALAFVGLDFYPGSVYPPVMSPADSYRSELAQAAGVVRHCYMPMAGIARRVPIWITENGVPTGVLSEAQQAAALHQLVQAVRDYSRTFGITDYRWFNLRDSTTGSPQGLVGPTFSSDGLLRADYSPKPAFSAYRRLIARLGTRTSSR